jgi:hypothetical protein
MFSDNFTDREVRLIYDKSLQVENLLAEQDWSILEQCVPSAGDDE